MKVSLDQEPVRVEITEKKQDFRRFVKKYLYDLSQKKLPPSIGNKAKNLKLLDDRRYLVPKTYVCTWEAFQEFEESGDVPPQLKGELEQTLKSDRTYAVRSSADLEDDLAYSFAGQFETYLDVCGVEQVVQAMIAIWRSTRSEAVNSYLKRVFPGHEPLKMAVLVQEMVRPLFSGVSFSKNPITGLDEIVVEAVSGSGVALVQAGVTPYRWVNKWGEWIEQPQDAPIPSSVIQQVVSQTKRIAATFRKDVDLEWVCDGEKLYWLQMRDITAMVQTDIYSNRISKEMTPGMIKPLVWSVKVPIPAAAWVSLFEELVGKLDVDPARLVRAFYYRAYFNMGVFGRIFDSLGMPRDSLEIMMGVTPPGIKRPRFRFPPLLMKNIPRLVSFLWDKWNFARKAKADYYRLRAEADRYSWVPSPDLDERQLLSVIDELIVLNQRCTYDTIVVILLMQIYSRLLKSRLEALGVDFQQFDLMEGMPELKQFDPNVQLAALHKQFEQLDASAREVVRAGDYAAFQQLSGIQAFQQRVRDFLEQFGHLGDIGTDFSNPPWRETPDLILKLIADFQPVAEQTGSGIRFQDLKLTGAQKRWLALLCQRARQFRLYREMHSSLYTYTLMLFRSYFLALGDRLVSRGLLATGEDIFYLYEGEIRALVAGRRTGEDFADLVEKRKAEMEACRNVNLPEVIYGDVPPPIPPAYSSKLNGTPTSKGYYTGKVKVVRSLSDFQKLIQGDVLVIPYCDVGWAPLFAKAGAVIAESGGMLSHSSIIAREYNIPAVVSVAGALSLTDNTLVTIDGYKGEIIIHTESDANIGSL